MAGRMDRTMSRAVVLSNLENNKLGDLYLDSYSTLWINRKIECISVEPLVHTPTLRYLQHTGLNIFADKEAVELWLLATGRGLELLKTCEEICK